MPDFPSGKQVQQYLESYAEVFDIRRHIQTNTRVVQVVRNDDDTKWIVRVLEDGQDKKAIEFDKVEVCIGAWVHPTSLRGKICSKERSCIRERSKDPRISLGRELLSSD
jgi:dimethylaniline monooxygenase (N-oxide forming)